MDDMVLNSAATENLDAPSEQTPQYMSDDLEARSDETLRAMIAQASAILNARAAERRRHALAEIQRLARENGLNVSVKKPARRRGRPRKVETNTRKGRENA